MVSFRMNRMRSFAWQTVSCRSILIISVIDMSRFVTWVWSTSPPHMVLVCDSAYRAEDWIKPGCPYNRRILSLSLSLSLCLNFSFKYVFFSFKSFQNLDVNSLPYLILILDVGRSVYTCPGTRLTIQICPVGDWHIIAACVNKLKTFDP